MIPLKIPKRSGYMSCQSLEQAQRINAPRVSNKRKSDERTKGLKDVFIAPTICKNL